MNELALIDAKHRLKEMQERTKNNCVIAFSGGKDSTVVAYIYKEMLDNGEIDYIPFIFCNTGVELTATVNFVKWFSENIQKVEIIKPEISFNSVLKKYGKPAISKIKSRNIGVYQNCIEKGIDPLTTASCKVLLGVGSNFSLASKHFNILNSGIKISQKCCEYMKKKPFEKYYLENNIDGFITGIRIEEGGARAFAYSSCTQIKKIKGKEIIHKMPLFDWSKKDVDDYLSERNFQISDAYTKYGFDRTGCIGCPFAQNLSENLEALYIYEKHKYKAVIHWFSDIYIEMGIELPFDQTYSDFFTKKQEDIKKRRYEMLKIYRKDLAEKYKPFLKTLF